MRQLAAILFADMTGYTALVQENEELARRKRKRLKEVLESTVATFNGRILQYYGDGSLSRRWLGAPPPAGPAQMRACF